MLGSSATFVPGKKDSGSISTPASTVPTPECYAFSPKLHLSRFAGKEYRLSERARLRELLDFSRIGSMDYVRSGGIEYARSGLVASWVSLSRTTDSTDDVVGLESVSAAMDVLYQWEHEKKGRMASAYAVYFVERNFSNHNISAVNDLLLNVAPERLTEWSMVALLRSSFSARSYLPAWPIFLDLVRHHLRDHVRVEKLLIGLNR